MQTKMDRVESLLFNYGTTNRTDIRPIDPEELNKIYLKPIKCANITSSIKDEQKNIDMISTGQDNKIQFHLEEIRPPRARIVMAPAVNIDNISDSSVRQILIKDMYTSSTQHAYGYESIWHDVKAPLQGRYAKANPLTLPKSFTPYVSPEWRAKSMEWDRKQMRSHCDANKVFWSTS